MELHFLLFAFWGSIAIVCYIMFGFPLIFIIRNYFWGKAYKIQDNYFPKISIIVAAYNEEDIIIDKLDSLLSANYPNEKIEIFVASDGSIDNTNQLVESYSSMRVKLVALPRQGKNIAISQVAEIAQADILVFSDAEAILSPDSLKYLIAPFYDSRIGGVSGDYIQIGDQKKQKGERAYWNYDRWLKTIQSRVGNSSGSNGQLIAIRRKLFSKIPSGVTDDFHTAMQVVSSGYRFIFEPKAVTYGPIAPNSRLEFRRKVRVITSAFHGIWLLRHLLNPYNYGFFSLQLFTHKVLRRLMVIPLIILFITAPLLWRVCLFYQAATIGQFIFHGLALLGYFLQDYRFGQIRILSLPFHFDMVYFAVVIAIVNNLRGLEYSTWIPER